MAARVQIQIEATDAASGVFRAIASQFGALGKALSDGVDVFKLGKQAAELYERALTDTTISVNEVAAAEQAANAAGVRLAETIALLLINAIKDAVNVTEKYAEEVRDLSAISGTGAEETSRFIQVLDDYQLSAQDAEAATRALTKQGLTPNIETLATLADQYLAIQDPMKQNEFIIKNLGRAGLQWVNVLKQGGDALRAQGAAVNENLIITDQQVKEMEHYRLVMDNVKDTIEGWKVATVLAFVDAQTAQEGAITTLKAYGMTTLEVNNQVLYHGQRLQEVEVEYQRASEYGLAWQKVLEDQKPALEDNAKALEEAAKKTTDYYNNLISGIESAQQETDRFRQTSGDLNKQISDQAEKIRILIHQGYSPMGKTVQDEQAKLDDLNGKLAANAAQHDKWAKQTVFAFAQARAAADGSISEGEGKTLIAVGEQLGLFDEQTAQAMESVNKAFENVDSENAKSQIDAVNEALDALNGKVVTSYINVVTNMGGGGDAYNGGGSYCFIAGTKVLTRTYEERNIEDMREGDYVISFDTNVKIPVTRKVEEVFIHDAHGYLLINGKLGVTAEHPLYVNGEWTAAGKIKTGDTLLNSDGDAVLVDSIEHVEQQVKVYNLHVESEPHNYFAGGVLVHNKQTGGAVYAGRSYMVGEAGSEPFIPAVNGRILGHAESLHALTLGGGGGNTNYFYGNVTLEIGEGMGDILGIRM